jgi:hypothetical protein
VILDPLPDTKRTRANLPHLIAAAEHLRAVDQLAREVMPCEHLPMLPPTGKTATALDDFNVMADHLGKAVRYNSRCTCRAGADPQLLAAHELAYTLWDHAYAETVFRATYRTRRAQRRMPLHVERLRRHRARFEHAARDHRASLEEDRTWVREITEQTRRDAEQAAAARKGVCCWVCGGDFYVPNDDPGDARGRYNCGSANCINAY